MSNEIDALCERLVMTYETKQYAASPTTAGSSLTGRIPLVSVRNLTNPDGPQAATALRQLQAENAALKAAKWDVRHTSTANDLVQMGMARDAAIAERDALQAELGRYRLAVIDLAANIDDWDGVAGSTEYVIDHAREAQGTPHAE
jgi:hypothetical protein